MVKIKLNTAIKFKIKAKRTNRGIHAKTKMSKCKTSKNYFKKSKGQG